MRPQAERGGERAQGSQRRREEGSQHSHVIEAEKFIAGECMERRHATATAAGPGVADVPEALPLPKGPFHHREVAVEAECPCPTGRPVATGHTEQRRQRGCGWVQAPRAAGGWLGRLSPPAAERGAVGWGWRGCSAGGHSEPGSGGQGALVQHPRTAPW